MVFGCKASLEHTLNNQQRDGQHGCMNKLASLACSPIMPTRRSVKTHMLPIHGSGRGCHTKHVLIG